MIDVQYHDISYDDKLANINNLKYLTWVGLNYNKRNKKILVIAESLYDWNEGSDLSKKMLENPEFVRGIVRNHGLYFNSNYPIENSKMFRSFERTFWGNWDISNEQRLNLWPSIAFHEFVQRPMINKTTRPNNEDYKIGAVVLYDVISILKPDICIFFGTDWKKLKHLENQFNVKARWHFEKINGAWPKIINLDDIKSKILMIKHPSKYFSWDKWYNFIDKESDGMINKI